MHPQAQSLWRGSHWSLALLLAGLSMLGPFSVDTYLPAFSDMARSLQATPLQMQQTLSAYLFAFAAMNLFHGALSDSLGRRPVVIAGLMMFSVASVGCALSPNIGWLVVWRAIQGMTAGAGMVVGRAIIRDLYPQAQAQRVMSQVTIFFGLAPVVAPLVGGWVVVLIDWRAIFWLLALAGLTLAWTMWRLLPESLHEDHRQALGLKPLMRGYAQLARDPRFLALALSSGVPFNGMFIYVLALPAWLGDHLHLQPTQFFWFFVVSVLGMTSGAALSGRLAGCISPDRQIMLGFAVMGASSVVNLVLNALWVPDVSWALFPVAAYFFGWSLSAPAVTLLLMDLVPQRRGMASSLQSFIGSTGNGLVAGVLVPWVMHSTMTLAWGSAAMWVVGLTTWLWVRGRLAPT
ncbi:MAG: Bcr/CflA family efflux MFS transporter [Betaproteobacteria bacterium]|nr:Bcr/CflA family efflux MFS transporter [Betaproteobacteria bacterium]